jgi:hypothetical protein
VRGDDLEGRLGVIVEAADEPRIDAAGDLQDFEVGEERGEVLPALPAEEILDARE